MKILSLRAGYETDHSSTQTKYITGFSVTCDYDWWTCEFEMPYQKRLYDKIKKYNASGDYELCIKKKGPVIAISIHVHLDYESIYPQDPFVAFANFCSVIRGNILKSKFGDLELLRAYVEDADKYHELDSPSGIERILDKSC